MNVVIALAALVTFHISKFEVVEMNTVTLFLKYVIPILIVGGVLAHLRLKFDSYASVLSYFLIMLVAAVV